jgi:hypothetical protein
MSLTKYLLRSFDSNFIKVRKRLTDRTLRDMSQLIRIEDLPKDISRFLHLKADEGYLKISFAIQGPSIAETEIVLLNTDGTDKSRLSEQEFQGILQRTDLGVLTLQCSLEIQISNNQPNESMSALQFQMVDLRGNSRPYNSPIILCNTEDVVVEEVNSQTLILNNTILNRSTIKSLFNNSSSNQPFLIEPMLYLENLDHHDMNMANYQVEWKYFVGSTTQLKTYMYACYIHSHLHKYLL